MLKSWFDEIFFWWRDSSFHFSTLWSRFIVLFHNVLHIWNQFMLLNCNDWNCAAWFHSNQIPNSNCFTFYNYRIPKLDMVFNIFFFSAPTLWIHLLASRLMKVPNTGEILDWSKNHLIWRNFTISLFVIVKAVPVTWILYFRYFLLHKSFSNFALKFFF